MQDIIFWRFSIIFLLKLLRGELWWLGDFRKTRFHGYVTWEPFVYTTKCFLSIIDVCEIYKRETVSGSTSTVVPSSIPEITSKREPREVPLPTDSMWKIYIYVHRIQENDRRFFPQFQSALNNCTLLIIFTENITWWWPYFTITYPHISNQHNVVE